MIQHGKPERNLSAFSYRGQRGGAREQGSSQALRKTQRQVNRDLAPGNMDGGPSLHSHQMPDRAFPSPGCAQGVPHQLYPGQRPGLKAIQLHPSASVLPVCTEGKDTAPVPNSHFPLSYTLACPAPIPSPLAQP